ncbi:carnitine O-palmitoyltransferase 1, liver isoform-like [Dendronephthya gigantea]|uniref:carnitine O-palmitoyltransferase 1, liver isoform-like n=1 Tax=Dendronephthya gigantea TaxID=151771 RepID=UPI0010697574|nr:carnitine O-palmitoyltransferase 1, liver isoform-like [Dendronephthya gigantea]
MAEARAAVSKIKVDYKASGTSTAEAEAEFLKYFYKSTKKCLRRTRAQISNGLWPTSPSNLIVVWIALVCMLYWDNKYVNPITSRLWSLGKFIYLDQSYHLLFRIFCISLITAVGFFVFVWYARQYALRILLSYRGWMYENPRSQSYKTLLWGGLVRVIGGAHPRLYSYQNSLPRMPVPALQDTCQGFLRSVKHILPDKEYKEMEELAKDFEKNLGPKLQFILQLRSWFKGNYHTDWWEKYVYLMNRDSIAINSNYYCLDHAFWKPTGVQTARAAVFSFLLLEYRHHVETEELEPLIIRNTIPLCMGQYERTFKTTRIPGEEIDDLVHYDHSFNEHLVVFCNGNFYEVKISDSYGSPITLLDLEKQLEWIKHDAHHSDFSKDTPEGCIPALTSLPRTEWYNIRRDHFSDGINKDSLDIIDKALFILVLDEHEFTDLSSRGKYLLHGDGKTLWFDKSFCVVAFADGKIGVNAEHSWGDAPVIGHMIEYTVTEEFIYRTYNDNGRCKPFGKYHKSKGEVANPMKLYFDVTQNLASSINDAYTRASKQIDDLQLRVLAYDGVGKGFIKKYCKMSPDGFIQAALHLAYYRDSGGRLPLTYESSMTRLYLQGRTETVRSLTNESKEFILAMENAEVSVEERVRLLRAMVKRHQVLYKDCMNGKGIDRHLFSLFVVSKGQGHDCEFLKRALTLPWTLSTSQQPQQQTFRIPGCSISDPVFRDLICPGGGFGPVADDGYGVSYMVPDEKYFFFHISSKKSSVQTDSERFINHVLSSLDEMKQMFVQLQGIEETKKKEN